jgi:hypothetical protein
MTSDERDAAADNQECRWWPSAIRGRRRVERTHTTNATLRTASGAPELVQP